jgi:UDP-glucuronate 4-epimerase
MTILVTGAAGFIGFHLAGQLLKNGHTVIGLDNINDYYSVALKYDRLKILGIDQKEAEEFNSSCKSHLWPNFNFIRMSVEDRNELPKLFGRYRFDKVCHLAAQAGVRYSLENPVAYVDSNIVGFLNILECCRQSKVATLVYASSSSVYGNNQKMPFSVSDPVDRPVSLYAATKKSNELMAHAYSHLYGISTIGLRFFTVYGPWGRPDMALFLFADAIAHNRPIDLFNHGALERDFTYIDDIVKGMVLILESSASNEANSASYRIYNIGNGRAVKLMDFVKAIEKGFHKKSEQNMLPMQAGDVEKTWANVDALVQDYHYKPNTSLQKGIDAFFTWYKAYYKV